MKNEFELAFNEITELRALPQDTVLEALRTALISAYRRDSNASAAQRVDAEVDPDTGRARLFVEKEVVEEGEVENPRTEVGLEKARYYEPECQVGDTVMVQVEETTKKFGRIAAQTAKQVILQKIREAERSAIFDEFSKKEGDIVNATVQSVSSGTVTLSLGRAEAIMPRAHQIPNERYRPHEKVRVYVHEVKRSNKGPSIIVSRSHRNMLRRLLEFEVPEIYNGQIEIKNIAREAGHRSKVAVMALQEGIDPVGACVGMRGIRIQNIVKELGEEKIDVIEWNPKQEAFIEKALSPARVTGVYLDDDPDAGRTAVVVVPDDQLSLAIGREGQNARLAAKLTGWRIDIKSVTESVSEALEHLDEEPLMDVAVEYADMVSEVGLIIEKREANRAIMPEEYRLLGQFADVVESRLQQARDEARQARLEELNAVKATLPQKAFDIPVQHLDLPDHLLEALQPLDNVGEIMLRFLIDEDRLRRLIGKNADDYLPMVQESLDQVMAEYEAAEAGGDTVEAETAPEEAVDEAQEAETGVPEAPEDVVQLDDEEEEIAAAAAQDAVASSEPPEDEAEAPLSAFPTESTDESETTVTGPKKSTQQPAEAEPALDELEDEEESDFEGNETGKGKKKRKKEKQKRRQLVYDEESGQTIAKRRRKGGRKRSEWDDM